MLVIDSHTGGEPTRVIIEGGPDLEGGSLSEQRQKFATHFDHIRKMAINEPRSSDAAVGALLCNPTSQKYTAGVIFFNTAGYLGMCGHGIIGVINTLAYLGKIQKGEHLIETPAGAVKANFYGNHTVSVENVASYRFKKDIIVNVPELGSITGDIAWGGNWFFLTNNAPAALSMENIPYLSYQSTQLRRALAANGITGENGAEIDHIEFFSKPDSRSIDSRNFVMCPGGAYDRSPCGTGTSAKIACLAADNLLKAENIWVQESITGSIFEASYKISSKGEIIPTITGTGYICGETTLIFQNNDPFRMGIS
jgi:4-hydroxyproline epimerase